MALYSIKNGKCLIYIAPFHRFFILLAFHQLDKCEYHPSSGHSLCHSFMRRSHLIPDQPLGSIQITRLPYHGYPMVWWSYSECTCYSTYHHCQVPFVNLGEVRQVWSSHLAQGCYMVSQLAALRFEPMTCAFRVPCTNHSATTSPYSIYYTLRDYPKHTWSLKICVGKKWIKRSRNVI